MNGQSAPHTPPPPPPPAAAGFFESVRRLGIWRTPDRWVGGVAAGIGRRYGLDPLLVRGIFVVVTLFGGLGLVLYGVAWALLPESSDGRIHLEQAVRGHFDIALAGALAVLIVGLSRPVFWWTGSWWAVPWVIVVGAVVAVVLLSRDRDSARPGPGAPPPGAGTPSTDPAVPSTDDAAPATSRPGTSLTTYTAPRPAYDVQEDVLPTTTDTDLTTPDGTDPDGTGTTTVLPAADGSGGQADEATAAGPGADTTTATLPGTTSPEDPAAPSTGSSWTGSSSSWDGGWGGSGGTAGGAGGGWGSGTGWDGSQPPPPPTPPVPGPGSRATSLVLALALLTAAGVALAHHQGALDANPWLVGGGAVLTILGAGVLVSGISGRSQGSIGVLGLLVALVMVPSATAAAALPGFARIGSDATTWAGDPTWVPQTAADAENGFSLVAGDLVVDLTELDADGEVTVPASVTFGNLNVLVPDDADVTVNASVGAGEIRGWLDDDWTGLSLPQLSGGGTLSNGVGISTTLIQEGRGSGPRIVVDAEVSFGQLTIEETS